MNPRAGASSIAQEHTYCYSRYTSITANYRECVGGGGAMVVGGGARNKGLVGIGGGGGGGGRSLGD